MKNFRKEKVRNTANITLIYVAVETFCMNKNSDLPTPSLFILHKHKGHKTGDEHHFKAYSYFYAIDGTSTKEIKAVDKIMQMSHRWLTE